MSDASTSENTDKKCNQIIMFKISKNEWRIIPLDYMLILSMEWRHRVVVITTAQLHSTNPELRFCTGSNPTCKDFP